MTTSISAYKALAPNEYTITPFRAYASHSYIHTSGSVDNSVDVQISFGQKYVTGSGLRIENSEQELYDSVLQTFYSPIPYASYGILETSYKPVDSVFVVSVTQDIFGEEIYPGSFVLTMNQTSSIDDGYGNLIVSESGTGSIVGRIFYDKGVAVIQPTSSIVGGGLSKNGICIVSGSDVQVSLVSSVQLYEHNIRAKIEPTEFMYSLYNSSATRQFFTGSTSTPTQLMVSRSLSPYVTSLGFYNERNELLAVAKLSNPIQRTEFTTQTFVVKFDT